MAELPAIHTLMTRIGADDFLDTMHDPAYAPLNQRIDDIIVGRQFRAAASHFGIRLDPQGGFANLVIEGPQGTGKTTLAKSVAKKLLQNGINAEGGMWLNWASKLTGSFTGWSGNIMQSVLDHAQNGILVIDDIQDVLASSQFTLPILNTLNNHLSSKVNNPIVIVTCYAGTRDRVVALNEGLAGRLANYWEMTPRRDTQFFDMLMRNFADARLEIEPAAQRACGELILNVQKIKKEQFAAAREIHIIFNRIMDAFAVRRRDIIPDMIDMASVALSEDDKAVARADIGPIIANDVPVYDGVLKDYVVRQSAAAINQIRPGAENLIAFPSCKIVRQPGMS